MVVIFTRPRQDTFSLECDARILTEIGYNEMRQSKLRNVDVMSALCNIEASKAEKMNGLLDKYGHGQYSYTRENLHFNY